MNPWINYHHLYYFMTIAELGSVSKAAERLRLGQPTLSAQLKQFEDSLGVQLFQRQHKRLILSEHGKLAFEYAKNIFKLGSEMYDALHDRLKPAKPSVQLGALDSIPKQIMLKVTELAYETMPCSITLVEGKFEDLMKDLVSFRLDLAITDFLPTASSSKGIFHRSLVKQSVGVFGAPKYKTLRKDFPNSIEGQKFVLPTFDSQVRYAIEHWLKIKNVNVEVVAETQDTALKVLMATTGMALIPTAEHAIGEELKAGRLIEIGSLATVNEELFLITAHRKIENPVAAAIMKNFAI